jgi:dipeptidyl aminopeptidase/acylaminoacyl peptidase
VTVTAPPRPPRPSDPIDREELEALVEALIEEARQRQRRRRRIYMAVAAAVTLVAVVASTVVERATQSQTASPALAARTFPAAEAANSTIAFMGSSPLARGLRADELYVVNADGSGKRLVARVQTNIFRVPVWSPDGRTIAFEVGRLGADEVVNVDGTAERNLTRNPAQDYFPAWSPDGRKIAFLRTLNSSSRRGEPVELYVMNSDGTGQRRLTRAFGA